MTRMTRRDFLKGTVALTSYAALPSKAKTERSGPANRTIESYQLGCQTLPYRGQPISRAFEGIRRAGYRYVMLYHNHAGKPVFTPGLSATARTALRAQINDAGLEPFMSFVGLTADPRTAEGLSTYLKELDLCAEFGIHTVVGIGPWYYSQFPNVPKRMDDWARECDEFYSVMESIIPHAETVGVTITLKPHTGITARAKDCLQVVKRIVSDRLQICWDAGNVSFYEGIYPDPDLPALAPHVKAVCIKDHLGGRADANFPVPGTGQIDHEQMFRILFDGGFSGPLAVERVDGRDDAAKMAPELIDQRVAAAYRFLAPLLAKCARGNGP